MGIYTSKERRQEYANSLQNGSKSVLKQGLLYKESKYLKQWRK